MVQIAGFEIYYQEPYGDYAVQAGDGLDIIGAHKLAEVVRRANSLFEDGWPPRDKTQRIEQLKKIGPFTA